MFVGEIMKGSFVRDLGGVLFCRGYGSSCSFGFFFKSLWWYLEDKVDRWKGGCGYYSCCGVRVVLERGRSRVDRYIVGVL